MNIQAEDRKARRPWAIPTHWRQAATCCGLATALLYIRRPDAFTRPQLWAEDATKFFLQNDQLGWHALFQPHAGYLHLVLRLIAWLGTPFAPFYTPEFYSYCSLACLLLVILRLFSPRVKLPAKPWLALATVLVPHSGEVFMNLTNAQWVLALILISMLTMDDGHTPLELAGDLLAVLFIGLTGPFSILLSPMFACRWLTRRTRASLCVFALMLACATVQAWFVLHGPPPDPGVHASVGQIVSMLVRRVFLSLYMNGFAMDQRLATIGVLMFMIIPAGLWARRTLARPQGRQFKIFLWVSIVLFLGGAGYRQRLQIPSLAVITNADRYFYVPKVLLLWLIALETASKDGFGWLARGVFCWCILVNYKTLRQPQWPDLAWKLHSRNISAGRQVDIPINPAPWRFQYPGKPDGK